MCKMSDLGHTWRDVSCALLCRSIRFYLLLKRNKSSGNLSVHQRYTQYNNISLKIILWNATAKLKKKVHLGTACSRLQRSEGKKNNGIFPSSVRFTIIPSGKILSCDIKKWNHTFGGGQIFPNKSSTRFAWSALPSSPAAKSCTAAGPMAFAKLCWSHLTSWI